MKNTLWVQCACLLNIRFRIERAIVCYVNAQVGHNLCLCLVRHVRPGRQFRSLGQRLAKWMNIVCPSHNNRILRLFQERLSTCSLKRSTSRFDSFPSSVADHIVILYSVSGARFFIVWVNLVVLNSYSEPPPEHEQISLNLSTFPSGASHFIDALSEKIRVAWIFWKTKLATFGINLSLMHDNGTEILYGNHSRVMQAGYHASKVPVEAEFPSWCSEMSGEIPNRRFSCISLSCKWYLKLCKILKRKQQ